jgi:peptidoglycan hydrolase-like protein with peptidoglycan-binding domain
VFVALAAAGYERFDVASGADLAAWRARQQSLGVAADGIPGPATVAALKGIGAAGGLWALRPGAARVA